MKKRPITIVLSLVAILCIVTVAVAVVWGVHGRRVGQQHSGLAFGRRQLAIEEVSSPEAQEKGLGGRASISDHEGMLFVFDQADMHCFWMKDMQFPIDMLWLDASKTVVHLEQNVPPDSYPKTYCPEQSSNYVLEVQAGLSAKAGVGVGSRL
jgi:uncharacterized membrane protein (UPF0127 family)